MTHYLLSIYTPVTDQLLPPEFLDEVMRNVRALNQEMRDAGVWVFGGGLDWPSTATVLRRSEGGEVLATDGPYLEGKEYLGGFTVINAPDLATAREWGRKHTEVIGLPIEVRAFVDDEQR